MFSCEFCEISKNTFFTEHLWWLLLFLIILLLFRKINRKICHILLAKVQ